MLVLRAYKKPALDGYFIPRKFAGALVWICCYYNFLRATSQQLTSQSINFEKSNEYSLEEVNTGEIWLDSKPIYRKLVNLTRPTAAGSTNIAHNIPDVETPLGISLKVGGGAGNAVGNGIMTSATAGYFAYLSTTNIVWQNIGTQTSTPVIAICEYTKTTDQPA